MFTLLRLLQSILDSDSATMLLQPLLGEVLKRRPIRTQIMPLLILPDQSRPWIQRQSVYVLRPHVCLLDQLVQCIRTPLHVLPFIREELATNLDFPFRTALSSQFGVESASSQQNKLVKALVIFNRASLFQIGSVDGQHDFTRCRVVFALVVLEAEVEVLLRCGRSVGLTERRQFWDLELDCAEEGEHLTSSVEDSVTEGGDVIVVELGHLAEGHGIGGIALLTRLGRNACRNGESSNSCRGGSDRRW